METVVDYCLGLLTMLSDFVEYLQKEWKPIHFGVIGYMNTIRHILDFRRSRSAIAKKTLPYLSHIRFIFKDLNGFYQKRSTFSGRK